MRSGLVYVFQFPGETTGSVARALPPHPRLDGNPRPDHLHMFLSVPPKFSIAHRIGFLKGKSEARIHRELLGERRMTGLHFWATGYRASTVGLDEAKVRQYIRDQEKFESGQGDLDLK